LDSYIAVLTEDDPRRANKRRAFAVLHKNVPTLLGLSLLVGIINAIDYCDKSISLGLATHRQ
jgi:hypothetical protein